MILFCCANSKVASYITIIIIFEPPPEIFYLFWRRGRYLFSESNVTQVKPVNTAFISYIYICSTLSVSNSPNYTELALGQMPGHAGYFHAYREPI